jgi:hypothetical protein
MFRIKIIKCTNRFLWYWDEANKKAKEKRIFEAEISPDKKGIVTKKFGYVFNGHYKKIR